MKAILSSRVLFTLLVALLVGCNWTQLVAFRAQMRDISRFTAWKGNENAVFVFKQPLLTMRDLNDFDVYPEVLDERNAVLRYHRLDAPSDTQVEYEIRLQFIEGKLAGLIFPSPLRDGLGQDNIRRLFAMMGGPDVPEAGIRALPKSQLVSAGLFPETGVDLGREVVIDLMPLDPRNRPIYIKMTETQRAGYYGDFFISLKRRT